jgi:hypothetical protein
VFMGDSITDAWQQPRYGGFFPGKPYVDRGISGQTTTTDAPCVFAATSSICGRKRW